MSKNYYSEINLHIVWHTKDSLPLLTENVAPLVCRCLKNRIMDTPLAFVHEIGGIETHLHLAVTVPPTLLISDWIGQVKGGTAHDVNQQVATRDKVLQWQAGYGVVSFGRGDLDWVTAYIRNQRQHHSRGTVQDRLERFTQLEDVSWDCGGLKPEQREGP